MQSQKSKEQARADKRAAALRDNLRKRKALAQEKKQESKTDDKPAD